MSKLNLFKDQRDRFVEALIDFDSSIWFPALRGGLEESNPDNWFVCFVPASWGSWSGRIYGVHFDFIYGRPRSNLPERLRLAVGVETPLLESKRQEFKEEVISRVKAKGIALTGFDIHAKPRTKLIEAAPIPFSSESWHIALQRYIALKPFVGIVGRVIKEYYEQGAFTVPINFEQ